MASMQTEAKKLDLKRLKERTTPEVKEQEVQRWRKKQKQKTKKEKK